MDTKQKYVRLKEFNQILIFPCDISHDTFKNLDPISAGFCHVHKEEVNCFGNSFSLSLEAKEDDSFRATLQLFGFDAAEKLEEKK